MASRAARSSSFLVRIFATFLGCFRAKQQEIFSPTGGTCWATPGHVENICDKAEPINHVACCQFAELYTLPVAQCSVGYAGVFDDGRTGRGQPAEGWEQLSGKFALVAQMLNVLWTRTRDKIVIVSNYTQTLDLMSTLCRARKYPCVRLDGNTSIKNRQKMVRFSVVKVTAVLLEKFCNLGSTQSHLHLEVFVLSHGRKTWANAYFIYLACIISCYRVVEAVIQTVSPADAGGDIL